MHTFESLLDYRELNSLYRATPSIQDYYFTSNFHTPLARDVDSDTVEQISITATTTPGPGNARGGAARRIAPKGATKRFFQLFHYFTQMDLPADCLRALREPESFALMEKGKQIVELQQEEMAIKLRLFKEVVLSQVLSTGVVNLDVNGNILTPSVNSSTGVVTDASGTVISASFGVDDGNRGNVGSIIDALWSTASTKISKHLDEIVRDAASNGAPRPRRVYVNGVKKYFLRNNTEFNDWAKYNGPVDKILAGEMIPGLWGFDWYFVDGTWTDSTGTTRDLIPQTRAIIMPEPGPWLRAHNGSEMVPSSMVPAGTVSELVNQLDKVYGEFTFASMGYNPVTLSAFYGDNFGLNFADPNAIYQPTVFS